ncbi:MAG: response regulator transcription factor [Eubacterium sp.]|nr:response regulator transcription factor [Eubacterium sp.]MCD8239495.1 response regulator transcription factor [Clostridiales bacterium]
MERKYTILVADDEAEIREVLRVLLESEGYNVIEAVNGDDAVNKIDESISLIILDVMMPVKDGLKACAEIREKTMAPILFLTAKTEDSDKTMGFCLGGDDYMVKPFSFTEIVARVKALLRRYYIYRNSEEEEGKVIKIGDLVIDTDKNSVTVGGNEVILTDIEYNILLLLASHRKKIFTNENIYESVWNEMYVYSASNTVTVHIRKLRSKIEKDPQNPKYIKTVWGRGYRIE